MWQSQSIFKSVIIKSKIKIYGLIWIVKSALWDSLLKINLDHVLFLWSINWFTFSKDRSYVLIYLYFERPITDNPFDKGLPTRIIWKVGNP